MENEADRLATWLEASAGEWHAEQLIQAFFERLAGVEEPGRYIALFYELMDIPLEALETLLRAIKPESRHEPEPDDAA